MKIVTDVDGVLLDWESSFTLWMLKKGFRVVDSRSYYTSTKFGLTKKASKSLVCEFNESYNVLNIPSLRDSIKYVKRLAEEGCRFDVITSMSDSRSAGLLRENNLIELFGNIFDDIQILSCGADKRNALKKYKGSGIIWIEDKIENSEVGYKMGMRSVLMKHSYNEDYSGPIKLVNNWREIYELFVSK